MIATPETGPGAARPPRGRPLVTLSVVALAAALAFLPTPSRALALERARAAGEPWRLLTGHLVHAGGGHALVDLAVLGVLGAWWELRSRGALVALLVGGALAASLAVLALTGFERYVGSSALGSALFVAAALELAGSRRGAARVACVLALAAFVAKCALEAAGLLPGSLAPLPEGTEVAGAAHAAGGAVGALVAIARGQRGAG